MGSSCNLETSMITLVTGVITTIILSLMTICFVKSLVKKLQLKHEEVKDKEEWTDQDLSQPENCDMMNEPDNNIIGIEHTSDEGVLSGEIYTDIKDSAERNYDLSPNTENM